MNSKENVRDFKYWKIVNESGTTVATSMTLEDCVDNAMEYLLQFYHAVAFNVINNGMEYCNGRKEDWENKHILMFVGVKKDDTSSMLFDGAKMIGIDICSKEFLNNLFIDESDYFAQKLFAVIYEDGTKKIFTTDYGMLNDISWTRELNHIEPLAHTDVETIQDFSNEKLPY